MTINQLNKLTAKLVADGHGRKSVCVDKSKVTHVLESDGCVIIPATSCSLDTHEMLDEDGGFKILADGRTAERTALVIRAEC